MEILKYKNLKTLLEHKYITPPLYCRQNYIPGITSFACWQKHARSPPPRPTACCELDSAGSRYMDPEAHSTELGTEREEIITEHHDLLVSACCGEVCADMVPVYTQLKS